jgi:hypothetical protein
MDLQPDQELPADDSDNVVLKLDFKSRGREWRLHYSRASKNRRRPRFVRAAGEVLVAILARILKRML